MTPSSTPAANLAGIDWVVFAGNSGDASQAATIASACHDAKVAFHYHRIDSSPAGNGPCEATLLTPVEGAAAVSDHPFGNAIQLHRPTLSALRHSPLDINSPHPSSVLVGSAPSTAKSQQPNHMKPVQPSVPHSESPAERSMVTPMVEQASISTVASTSSKQKPKQDALASDYDAGEIAVEGNIDSSHGDNAGAEELKFDILPDKSSLGSAKVGKKRLATPDLVDFKRLHGIVVRCAGLMFDAGNALAEIRNRKLWRAGGYSSWNAYCEGVQGITKRHANHLIATAEAVGVMRQVGEISPTSAEIVPEIASQVTPLLRIKDELRRNEAWVTAVERSGGEQPKPKIVAQVVAEILEDLDKPAPSSPKQPRATLRADVLSRLKAAVDAREDWDLVAGLLEELDDVL